MDRLMYPVTSSPKSYLVFYDSSSYGQAVCQYGGTIITWGGSKQSQYEDPLRLRLLCTNLVNPNKPYWIQVSCDNGELPDPTTGASMVLVRGHLVIFGGFTLKFQQQDQYWIPGNSACTNDVYILSLERAAWRRVRYGVDQMRPSPRDKCCSWDFYNLAYFFGGYGSQPRNPWEFKKGNFRCNSEMGPMKFWNNQLLAFDCQTDKWTCMETFGTVPSPRAAAAACINKNIVYLFGGRLEDSRLKDLYTLDMHSMIWAAIDMEIPPDLIGRSWCTASITRDNTRLYIWGGLLSGTTEYLTEEILVADLENNSWSRLQPAANKRFWHVGGFNDGVLYVLGGSSPNNDKPDPDVEHRRVQPASLTNLAFTAIPTSQKGLSAGRLLGQLALRSLLNGSPTDFPYERLNILDVLQLSSLQ